MYIKGIQVKGNLNMVRIVQTFFILSFLLLVGCSRLDLHLAEKAYAQAKTTKQAEPIIVALSTLAMLAPELYQSKLNSAQMALVELQKAKSYMAESNFYLAYLASHMSYRTLPTKESKSVLIQVGRKLRYLLNVQANIVKSFQYLPKSIPALLSKYKNKPAVEWDLIEVNSVIEQFVSSAKAIKRSLTIIELEKGTSLSAEIKQWQLALHSQLQMINQIKTHLINLALYSSANVLEKINVQLTEDSANLLSLVRENLAEEAMRPNFIKANEAYQPYYHLNENLALASSSSRGNSHATWYSSWHSIEVEILESSASFSEYPLVFTDRAKKLSLFKDEAMTTELNLEQGFFKLNSFIGNHQAIYSLIDKLNRDRMILNYGEPSA